MKNPYNILLPALLFLCLPVITYAADDIEVEDPWVREAPPTAKVVGAFMVLKNHSNKDVSLSKVTSPDYGTIEIHRTEMRGDMAHMVAIPSLDIGKHSQIELKPGSYHLMLFNPKKRFIAGEKIMLMLYFSDNTMLHVNATVKKGMGGSDHSHHHDNMYQHEEHKEEMNKHENHEEHHDKHNKH